LPQAAPSTRLQSERRFLGHWQDLLWDLGYLGRVRIECASASASLAHYTDLAGLRVRAELAYLQGPRSALRILLDRCLGLRGSDAGGPELVIEDNQGRAVTSLRPAPNEGASAPLWRMLLRSQGVLGRTLAPEPPGPRVERPVCDAREGPFADLERRCQGLDDGLDLLDLAELAGLLSLHPARLRDLGWAIDVDPTLLPCVLAALVDHVVPMRVVLGNDAAVLRLDFAPYLARLDSGWQTLRSDQGELRLDTRALDSAWIYRPADRSVRQLRLYDRDGRALAVIAAAPTPDGAEPTVWRTLINALLD
jgi:putative hemin transport protein